MKQYKATSINHKGQRRIAVEFENKLELRQRFKQLRGAKWSVSKKVWHLPDTKENRKRFGLPMYDTTILSVEKITQLTCFENWLTSHRYSENTIKTYLDVVRKFLHFYKDKAISKINNDDLIRFNNEYIIKRKFSNSYQNQFINGLKLFFKIVEQKQLEVDLIQRPREEKKLPHVLSKREVKAILGAPVNLKHRTILSIVYACGLRRSEVLSLKSKDILSDRYLLRIYQAKGNKDRVVPIGDKTITMLREYYKTYRPKVWLFEGQEIGQKYSPTSIQEVLKKAVKKAGVKKKVTLHWLRHSYATHLLESGTDIRYIQELLGHKSSKTTEIYTHVSNRDIQRIKSPFDDL